MSKSSGSQEHPFRYYSFWSINGELDLGKLCRQMDALQQAGLDGVVFHPRFYPGIPTYLSDTYLSIVNDAILYAKSIGLRFWLYDENGWPSGSADGRLLEKYPDENCVRLDLEPGILPGAVTTFHRDAQGGVAEFGEPWSLVPRKIVGIDCLNPEASRHFLELIHEQYRLGLSAEAFEYVEAFFTDEPESGASWEPLPTYAGVPWTKGMQAHLIKIWGEDFRTQLPLLFCDAPGSVEARIAYWELVADLFGQGFLEPYRLWCERYGKLLVGHVKGEEHPLFQIPMVGSCQQIFRHFSLPGIDALERFPSNNFFPRQAASVAAQYGSGRCVVEAFGGSGWGASPEDLERYLLWLGRNGITDCVLHLSQYDLNSRAIRDWPPSQPLHLSWKEAYASVLAKVRHQLNHQPVRKVDTLVIAPYPGIMADYGPWELLETNIHNASIVPDTRASRTNAAFLSLIESLDERDICYHTTDERTFEEEAVEHDQGVSLGNCCYKHVVAAEGCRLTSKALRLTARAPGHSEAVGKAQFVSRDALQHLDRQKVEWQIASSFQNAFFIESTLVAADSYQASITSEAMLSDVVLRFADRVQGATWNDDPVTLVQSEMGWEAKVRIHAGLNTLHYQTPTQPGPPFVWLLGAFVVRSEAEWATQDDHLVTKGPFILGDHFDRNATDLVTGGFPFTVSAIRLEGKITLPPHIDTIQLRGLHADAALVGIEGRQSEWTWGPSWKVSIPATSKSIETSITIDLFPSTFNHFGPHHYFRGDAHVISPDQFVGVRNFADPANAPSSTTTPNWAFRAFEAPREIQFYCYGKPINRNKSSISVY